MPNGYDNAPPAATFLLTEAIFRDLYWQAYDNAPPVATSLLTLRNVWC